MAPLWAASGDDDSDVEQSIPSSAFTRGDCLVLTSSSSLSKADTLPAVATNKVSGIAMANSTQSILNKVPFKIINDNQLWWSDITTTLTSHITVGELCGIAGFVTGDYVDPSTATSRVICVRGMQEINQSTRSRVLVKFLTSTVETSFE